MRVIVKLIEQYRLYRRYGLGPGSALAGACRFVKTYHMGQRE